LKNARLLLEFLEQVVPVVVEDSCNLLDYVFVVVCDPDSDDIDVLEQVAQSFNSDLL
jgi:hypothetical protein